MESSDDTLLSARLAGLPLESPPSDAWAAIARRVAMPAPPRRQLRRWVALAAGVAALALLPLLRNPVPTTAPPAAEVLALMQRSQQLEDEIRDLRAWSTQLDDVQYAWERAIQSDLAVVDVGLAAQDYRSQDLWRERIRLLEELKTISQADSENLRFQARQD